MRNTSASSVPRRLEGRQERRPGREDERRGTQTARGRRPIPRASRPHSPRRTTSVGTVGRRRCGCRTRRTRGGSARTARGTVGRRTSSRAGRKVSAARNADAMPIAATGPRLLLDARSDSVRHSSPATTVPALAAIGSIVARTARAIAVDVARGVAQLLAVPRDQQQRVVHRRAHDEDRQDPLGLPVEREHPGRGELVDHERRGAEREQGGEDHDERQERRPVDDDEDEQHGAERDEQQHDVDPAERGHEVGDEAGRTGHPGLQAEVAGPGGGRPQLGVQRRRARR